MTRVADGIYVLPDILSAEECEEFIDLSELVGFDSAPISAIGGAIVHSDVRNNDRAILDNRVRASSLWARVKSHVPGFLNGRQALGLNERLRFYRYGPDQQFAPHVDGSFVRANGERSLLTFMLYLNEGFEGGETKFNETTIQPAKAMALIFRHELLHEGAAVISGRKYVLRSDVMFGAVGYIRG